MHHTIFNFGKFVGVVTITKRYYLEFEIPTAVIMKSSIFWDITPYSKLKVNRRFGGTGLCLPPAFTLVSCLAYWLSRDYMAFYPRTWYYYFTTITGIAYSCLRTKKCNILILHYVMLKSSQSPPREPQRSRTESFYGNFDKGNRTDISKFVNC
jgi:hypothetical protein